MFMLHFAIKEAFPKLHIYPYPIIQSCTKEAQQKAWHEVKCSGHTASVRFGTPSGGKPCLPPLLTMPGPGRKGRQQGWASRKPCYLQQGLACRGPRSLRERAPSSPLFHAGTGLAGWGRARASGQESGTRSPFGAAIGAQFWVNLPTPCDFSKRTQNPLLTPPPPRTSMKRSREFSFPINGANLSRAQKELFIRCSWHSVCLYRAQACSEAQQKTFFLKAQLIGQLQSPGPQNSARGSSLGIDIKGTRTGWSDVGVDSLRAARGGLRGFACPQPLESWGRQPGGGTALWNQTSKALGHCLTCRRQLSKMADRRWRAEDWGGQQQLTPNLFIHWAREEDTGFKCGRAVWSLAVHSKDPTWQQTSTVTVGPLSLHITHVR